MILHIIFISLFMSLFIYSNCLINYLIYRYLIIHSPIYLCVLLILFMCVYVHVCVCVHFSVALFVIFIVDCCLSALVGDKVTVVFFAAPQFEPLSVHASG